MTKISLATYDEEQQKRARRKEEMQKQKAVLSLRKSGDVARLRFLMDLDPLIGVGYHFVFNAADPSETIRAICADEFGKPCAYCSQARRFRNKALAAQPHIALPAWLHSLTNPRPSDDDAYEDEIGYKILLFKRGSDAVGTLRSYYESVHSITGCDWTYRRTGTGRDDTKYTLTALPPPPLAFDDLPETSEQDVMYLLAEAYPYVVDER